MLVYASETSHEWRKELKIAICDRHVPLNGCYFSSMCYPDLSLCLTPFKVSHDVFLSGSPIVACHSQISVGAPGGQNLSHFEGGQQHSTRRGRELTFWGCTRTQNTPSTQPAVGDFGGSALHLPVGWGRGEDSVRGSPRSLGY